MAQKNKVLNESIGVVNVVAMVALIILVGLGGHFLGKYDQNKNSIKAVAAVQSVAYNGVDGKTALDLLKEKASIETQDSSIGVFVTEINGIQNSEDHFWMFYVNGALSSVGADQYQSKNTDKIEWRYEQIQ